MKIVMTVEEVREEVKKWRKEGLTIGLVPTMGYLHEGHASLIKRAVQENDRVVVSDFVNPTQFGPNEDLESYPRDLDRDAKLCADEGAALIFNPSAEEMYFSDFSTYVNMTGPSDELCGKSRPIHFRGVCTVVSKLFNIVTPDRAYFGQKDAQQLAVIKRMVRDLNFDIEIVGCPIIREADGLAKSSRNTYLSAEERKAAIILHKALEEGKALVLGGEKNTAAVIEKITNVIQSEPLAKVDYVQVVSFPDVTVIDTIEGDILVAVAVYIGKTRLIDIKLLEAAGIYEYEKVQIVDIENGNRFETYTIAGEANSGMICLNGAAARCVQKGDHIIIMSYCQLEKEEADTHKPVVVFVDEENQIVRTANYEKHGVLSQQMIEESGC